MKKFYLLICAATLVLGVGVNESQAGKPGGSGDPCEAYGTEGTCTADSTCEWVVAGKKASCKTKSCTPSTEICTGGLDEDCDGLIDCDDSDCNTDPACQVCVPTTEVCNDGVDNDCDSAVDCADTDCTADPLCENPHLGITGTFNTPADVTAKCLECHSAGGSGMNVAQDVVNSLHGMMPTAAPNVTNMTRDSQKLSEINTFCSYPNPDLAGAACLGCHPTLGKFENLTAADIDCLQCHNDAYKRRFTPEDDPAKFIYVTDWQGTAKTYIPAKGADTLNFTIEFNWGAMSGQTATSLIAGVHRPTTTTCLSCHAKAGGGDWTKRGDIGLSSDDPPPPAEDVHLASAASGGAGLSCSDCHVSLNHKIPGRGIDLRPTESGVAVKECIECHPGMDQGGHSASGRRSEPDRHVKRVACKSCHIPAFGKGGATEMHRDWTQPEWNGALCNGQGAWAGHEVKESNVIPDHVWFDGTSYVYALGETLSKIDPISGLDLVADAFGDVNDPLGTSMLVPIKRHQSKMAVMSTGNDAGKVIPYDVVKNFMTGLYDEAAESGKGYAGYTGEHEWKWLEAEMGINHGVSPAASVAACTNCHHARNEFDYAIETKLDKLGYKLKDVPALICSQCHAEKAFKRDWEQMHAHTQKGSGIGCTFCHDISRPERGLCEPCNPDGTPNTACINEFVDTNPYPHCN